MAEKRAAQISWNNKERQWIMYLWQNGKWEFSTAWDVRSKGTNEITGAPIDYVHDGILCHIADLQTLGYKVTVNVPL